MSVSVNLPEDLYRQAVVIAKLRSSLWTRLWLLHSLSRSRFGD